MAAQENTRLLRSNNHTGYRGISHVGNGRWVAQIRAADNQSVYLGSHPTPEEAAIAYDDAAYELRGTRAILNFPERYRTPMKVEKGYRIPIAGGIIFVDDEDVSLVMSNHCTVERANTKSPSVYLLFNEEDGSTTKKRLAAVILGLEKGEPAVFVDGNRYNHRRSNLIPGKATGGTTAIQKRDDIGSGYKGVMFHEPSGTWNARIWNNGKAQSLGYCRTPDEAARVYDEAAESLWGEYALTNKRIGAKPNAITLERLEGLKPKRKEKNEKRKSFYTEGESHAAAGN